MPCSMGLFLASWPWTLCKLARALLLDTLLPSAGEGAILYKSNMYYNKCINLSRV